MSDPLGESSVAGAGDDQLGASEASGAQKSVEGSLCLLCLFLDVFSPPLPLVDPNPSSVSIFRSLSEQTG